MKFKLGDVVIQHTKNYGTSQIGWKGVVVSVENNRITCIFELYDNKLAVNPEHLKLYKHKKKSYLSFSPRNKPCLK